MENEKKTNSFTQLFRNLCKKIGDGFYWFLNHYDFWIYFLVITALAIVVRVAMFPAVTNDYKSFLTNWYTDILNNGFKSLGVQNANCNYTPPYLYFLWFISLFKCEPGGSACLNGIKIVSTIFDFGCAVFASLIVHHLTKDKLKTLLAYSLTIMGVTVILNSGWWGQCDSIYVSFLLASIYFYLVDQQRGSMIMLGIAFAFKLQSIFVLPVFIVAFLRRELKLRYIIYIPLAFIVMMLPACFAAGSGFFIRLKSCFDVYVKQVGDSYKQMSLNAGTFYTIIFANYKTSDHLEAFSIPFAIFVLGTFIYAFYKSKVKFDKNCYLKLFVFFSLLMPFILPHMHDRYYYLSDILIVLFAIMNAKKFYVAFLAIMNSMVGYMVYLFNVVFINVVPQEKSSEDWTKAFSFRVGGILCLSAITIIAIDIIKELFPKELEASN